MQSRNRGAGGYGVQGLKFSIHTIADLATRVYKFCTLYHISGKLLREKTFADFRVLWLFAKVFSTKFGGTLSFGVVQVSNPRKSYFSPICESFFPRKFPAIRYLSVPRSLTVSVRAKVPL